MEALAAIALAGNILQFVQLGLSVVSTANALRVSGSNEVQQASDIDCVTNSLRENLSELDSSKDAALQAMIDRCKEVGAELQTALAKVRPKAGRSTWASTYRQALCVMWNKDKIDAIETRLERLRDQMNSHLVVLIRQDLVSLHERSERNDATLQEIVRDVSKTREAVIEHAGTDISANELALTTQALRQLRGQLEELQWTRSGQGEENVAVSKASKEDFLETLEFIGMEDREENIADSLGQTYQWILMPLTAGQNDPPLAKKRRRICQKIEAAFGNIEYLDQILPQLIDREENTASCMRLQEWLQGGEGIFWIWGKPGCGKSTLMKAMVHNETLSNRFQSLLGTWSSERPLVIASFFFFRPGMSLQKSLLGLYRSLLHQIMTQRFQFLEHVFKESEQRHAIGSRDVPPHNWTVTQLRRAFRTWRRQDRAAMLFLHIDGVDEAECLPQDMVEILGDITRDAPNVKVLVTGRWAPEFEAAWGKPEQSLAMHEVTTLDIFEYAFERLGESASLSVYQERQRQFLGILKEICDAAEGVFLWVRIVIDSLEEGMLHSENYDQLYTRLREYPKDLDSLYWFLYQGIDSRHRGAASFWLLFVLRSAGLAFRLREISGSHTFNQLAALEFGMNETSFIQMSSHFRINDRTSWWRVNRAFTTMKHRRRSFGLLESSKQYMRQMKAQCRHFFHFQVTSETITVSFAHRTVADFLLQPAVSERLRDDLLPRLHPLDPFYSTLAAQLIMYLDQVDSKVLESKHIEPAKEAWRHWSCAFEYLWRERPDIPPADICEIWQHAIGFLVQYNERVWNKPKLSRISLVATVEGWEIADRYAPLYQTQASQDILAHVSAYHLNPSAEFESIDFQMNMLRHVMDEAQCDALQRILLLAGWTTNLYEREPESLLDEGLPSTADEPVITGNLFKAIAAASSQQFSPEGMLLSRVLEYGRFSIHHKHSVLGPIDWRPWCGIVKLCLEHGADPSLVIRSVCNDPDKRHHTISALLVHMAQIEMKKDETRAGITLDKMTDNRIYSDAKASIHVYSELRDLLKFVLAKGGIARSFVPDETLHDEVKIVLPDDELLDQVEHRDEILELLRPQVTEKPHVAGESHAPAEFRAPDANIEGPWRCIVS